MNLKLNLKAVKFLLVGLAAITPSLSTASPTNGKGMTFHVGNYNSLFGTNQVKCPIGSSDYACDPYQGDTSCKVALPILCINKSGVPDPEGNSDYYNGWADGHVGHTDPVLVTSIKSRANATDLCAAQLGDGYIMADFNDGHGGGNWRAYGNLRADTRYWVNVTIAAGTCY